MFIPLYSYYLVKLNGQSWGSLCGDSCGNDYGDTKSYGLGSSISTGRDVSNFYHSGDHSGCSEGYFPFCSGVTQE